RTPNVRSLHHLSNLPRGRGSLRGRVIRPHGQERHTRLIRGIQVDPEFRVIQRVQVRVQSPCFLVAHPTHGQPPNAPQRGRGAPQDPPLRARGQGGLGTALRTLTQRRPHRRPTRERFRPRSGPGTTCNRTRRSPGRRSQG